jgi:hypothetical protein
VKVKAWNNGSHLPDGNGYGIKIDVHDRDAIFLHEWKVILLDLESEMSPVEINIDKSSFWNKSCRELINIRIGKWLIKNQLAPWEKGKPPILTLEQVGGNRFKLYYSQQTG